jgi:uncharacterized protein YvpB
MQAHRSTSSSSPGVSRRSLVAAAGAAAVLSRWTRPAAATAQGMDPYTFITTMPATTDIGQHVGQPASEIDPVVADDRTWDAFIQVPIKEGQDFHFTCEFDSSWIILKAYGYDLTLQEQMEIVGVNNDPEPWYEETPEGVIVWGGDIDEYYCGHYDTNVLTRARCNAMRKVFEAHGLGVTFTPERPLIEAALLRGEPVFFKSTVDFLPWREAEWHTPDGDTFPVVLTNDHALTVMGFNADDVVIRDPLGPTTTNRTRPWQYRVSWSRFLEVLAAQGNDAIAVAPAPAGASSQGGTMDHLGF